MPRLILLSFAALALLQVGALCTGAVSQHGDAGPWTGEAANTGPHAVHGATVPGAIFDSNGMNLWGTLDAHVCPSVLLPGETGAFELDMHDPDFNPTAGVPPDYDPPLSARFNAISGVAEGYGSLRGDGLFVHEVRRNPLRGTIDVELWNNGTYVYEDITICAVRLDAVTREPADIVWHEEPSALQPGQVRNITLAMQPFGDGAPLRYYALGVSPAPVHHCCPPQGSSSWITLDMGPFSVQAPPGWQYVPARGIDSFVGYIRGDGVELTFDFGWYSWPIAPYGDPDHRVWDESVSGRVAKMVFAHDLAGWAGVYFGDVDFTRGEFAVHMPTALSLAGENLDEKERDIALQIFRSIRFQEQ